MVRIINFNVSTDGIEPSVRKNAGIQGEHNATELRFLLENSLYYSITAQKKDGDILRYRFDAFDGSGCALRSKSEILSGNVINYRVTSALSSAGGNAEVFLVITLLRDGSTETELLSYPAKLYFEGCSSRSDGASRESLTTLEQNAAFAALEAAKAMDEAEAAYSKAAAAKNETILARAAIESGSEFLFDGGSADNRIPIEYVVDDEISESSENAVRNRAIATRFNQTERTIASKTERADVSDMISSAIEEASADIMTRVKQQVLLEAHPVGCIYISLSETTDPAAVFGGSWERIAKGRTLVGAMADTDANYDEDFAFGKTGGEKYHTLTAAEIPAHTHTIPARLGERVAITGTDWTKQAVDGTNLTESGKTGGNEAHNNMPPYLAVYIWKRIG